MDASEQGMLSAAELARLGIMQRLAFGAAHTLNNTFTTVVAEASFLRTARKEDAEVLETCEVILHEMNRSAAITRALLARRSASQAGATEVDLARLVRELGQFLHEVVGRQHELCVEYPDDLVLAAGGAAELELLVLALTLYATDSKPDGTAIRLSASRDDGGRALLEWCVEAPEMPAGVADALLDPASAGDPFTRVQLAAVSELARGHRASLEAGSAGPTSWHARLRFPPVR